MRYRMYTSVVIKGIAVAFTRNPWKNTQCSPYSFQSPDDHHVHGKDELHQVVEKTIPNRVTIPSQLEPHLTTHQVSLIAWSVVPVFVELVSCSNIRNWCRDLYLQLSLDFTNPSNCFGKVWSLLRDSMNLTSLLRLDEISYSSQSVNHLFWLIDERILWKTALQLSKKCISFAWSIPWRSSLPSNGVRLSSSCSTSACGTPWKVYYPPFLHQADCSSSTLMRMWALNLPEPPESRFLQFWYVLSTKSADINRFCKTVDPLSWILFKLASISGNQTHFPSGSAVYLLKLEHVIKFTFPNPQLSIISFVFPLVSFTPAVRSDCKVDS